jgi:hypothetical protein
MTEGPRVINSVGGQHVTYQFLRHFRPKERMIARRHDSIFTPGEAPNFTYTAATAVAVATGNAIALN